MLAARDLCRQARHLADHDLIIPFSDSGGGGQRGAAAAGGLEVQQGAEKEFLLGHEVQQAAVSVLETVEHHGGPQDLQLHRQAGAVAVLELYRSAGPGGSSGKLDPGKAVLACSILPGFFLASGSRHARRTVDPAGSPKQPGAARG